MDFDSDRCKLDTLSYYESWLGEPGCLSVSRSSQQIYTTKRNITQIGYSSCMDIYVWIEPERIIVSYGDAVISKIDELKKLKGNVFEVSESLYELFDIRPSHAVKYFYQSVQASENISAEAKTLTLDDYSDFEKFWLSRFPDNKGDWLREYFEDMTKFEFCVGVYTDGVLASCTDAATMPYMAEQLQEIGINTLEKYRGQGYAAIACHKAAINILQGGRYPIWSHGYSNIASQRIAEKIGFAKLADVLMMSL